MIIDHVAIWAKDLEVLKGFYMKYFGGVPNTKYVNQNRQFSSYFLTFKSGCRLELMTLPHLGATLEASLVSIWPGMAHISFGVDTMEDVDAKAEQLRADGFPITNGPRKTGDGSYEFETMDPEGNKLEISALNTFA